MKEVPHAGRGLIRAIDPYLPAAIQDNTSLTLEELIRSRVLVSLMVAAIILLLFSCAALMVSWYFTGANFTTPVVLSTACLLLTTINYLYFYKVGRLDSSAVAFSLTLFLLSIISIVLTGGFESPALPILVCVPVIAFLVGGRQEGIYNAVLAYVVATVLLVLHAREFPMMQLLPDQVKLYVSGLVWFVTMAVIVVCLYVYDALLEETRTTIAYNDQNTP